MRPDRREPCSCRWVCTELIAQDQEDYSRIAADLAEDPVRLAGLHRHLRSRLAASSTVRRFRFRAQTRSRLPHSLGSLVRCEGTRRRRSPAPVVEAFPVRLSDGSILALPPSLNAITTYVALEQEAWFEKEAGFPALWLKTGMTAIDIGAHLGVYSYRWRARSGHQVDVVAYEPCGSGRCVAEAEPGTQSCSQSDRDSCGALG